MAQANRLAFIAPRFPDGPTVGGAETLLKNLAIHAADAGRKVTFLTTCARNHFTWENEIKPGSKAFANIEVIFFPVNQDRDIPAFLRAQELISRRANLTKEDEETWLKNNVNSDSLIEHLNKHGDQYDRVIIGPYLFGLTYYAAQIMPDKTIMVPCLHDEAFAYIKAFQQLFHSVRGFMFNSEPEKDLADRIFWSNKDTSVMDKHRQQSVNVVGMGLDTFDSDPENFKKRHNITAPYLLYSGRREPMKGTPVLIDYLTAFRKRTNRDIKLILTGTGQYDASPAFANHITDLGFVSEEDKHSAMAGALAFCHPSVNESFGIVILEAWLAGTPSLVHAGSDVLAFQCKRSNGGLWFKTYPEFEEELLLLMDNNEIRNKLAESGRNYVQREYSWSTVTKKMLHAIDM